MEENKNNFGKLVLVAVLVSVVSGVIVSYINDTQFVKKLKNGDRKKR